MGCLPASRFRPPQRSFARRHWPDRALVRDLMDTPHPSNSPEGLDMLLPLLRRVREIRRRFLIVAASIGIMLIITWTFSTYIMDFIERPVLPYAHLQFDTLTDPFFTYFKAAIYAAVFLTFPITLSQFWAFLAPTLEGRNKRLIRLILILSFPMFVGGGLFCYWVVYPLALHFLIDYDRTLLPSLRVGDYTAFTIRLLFVFGLVFETPLLSLLLTRLGVIKPDWLRANRRYAIIMVFIAAAIITPSGDAFTQCLLAGPLLLLFEVSVWVSRFSAPRKPKPEPDVPPET